jgi:hypothetical protein
MDLTDRAVNAGLLDGTGGQIEGNRWGKREPKKKRNSNWYK